MSLLLFFPSVGVGGDVKLPRIAPPIQVIVNGSDRTGYTRAVQNLRIEYSLGSRTVLSCEFVDHQADTSAAYRPAIDQPVAVLYDGVTLFFGTVLNVQDRALGDPSLGVVTRISATSSWRAAAARLVTASFDATGYTLRDMASHIVNVYLSPFGITLDPAMPNGPTLGAVSFDYVTVEAAFQRLADLTGWVYRLTPSNVVQWFQIGAQVVPVTLSAANANVIGGVTWGQTRGRYVNRQFIRYGTSSVVLKTDVITADGVLQSWPLKHPGLLAANGFIQSRGLVNVNGVDKPLGWYGIDSTEWLYDPASNGLYTTTVPAAGVIITFVYNVQFPLVTYDEDTADVGSRGPWEDMVDAPDIFDFVEAKQLATALLRRYSAVPRELQVRTRAATFQPGDTVVLDLPQRAVSISNWLVTAVTMADDVDQALTSTLTLLEGTEAQGSWLDFWRTVLGGGTSSGTSGSITGNIVPSLGSHFEDDVIARAGDDGVVSSELALRGNILSASYSGPALTLGRLGNPFAWAVVGDQLQHEQRGLYFVPLAERLTTRYAAALRQSFTAATDGQYFLVPNGGAAGSLFLGGSVASFGPGYRVSMFSNQIDNAAGITTATLVATTGSFERGRTTMVGDWAEVPFTAGTFTGAGSMTVTLQSTDQARYRMMRVGSTLYLLLTLKTFTIGGTPSDQVRVALPSGLVSAVSEQWTVYHYLDNGTQGIGLCGCGGAGATYVQFFLQPFGTAWAASTNASEIRASVALEVLG